MQKIIITMEGGVIQDISNIPPDTQIIVKDFDDGDETHPQWDASQQCFIQVWE